MVSSEFSYFFFFHPNQKPSSPICKCEICVTLSKMIVTYWTEETSEFSLFKYSQEPPRPLYIKKEKTMHCSLSYQQMGQFIFPSNDIKDWTISQLSYFHRAMQSKFAENLSLISHLNFRMSDIVGGKIAKDNEVEMNEFLPSRTHGSTLTSLHCCQ